MDEKIKYYRGRFKIGGWGMKADNIELSGELIESFERVEKIVSIILLGENGGIRKIDIE